MAAEVEDFVQAPEYGITISQDNQGKFWLGLSITTAQSTHVFFLCRTSDYEETARKLHKGIMDAGREGRRAASGLIVAKGDVSAVVPQAERRK